MKIAPNLNPIDIALSGIQAQNANMTIISSNVANSQTLDNGDGQPYRRVEALFKTDGEDGVGGVSIDGTIEDMSDFMQILKPGHPKADSNGYVSMPNVSVPEEMMNLSQAAKAYQANAAVLRRYQSMVETSLELLR